MFACKSAKLTLAGKVFSFFEHTLAKADFRLAEIRIEVSDQTRACSETFQPQGPFPFARSR